MPIDSIELDWTCFEKARHDFKMPAATTFLKEKPRNEFQCECGGVKVFNEDGLPTCTSCGLTSDWIDDSPEWINTTNDDGSTVDKSRCGVIKDTELFSEQWGNGTMMVSSGRQSAASRRIAKINFHQSMNHRDRALYHAYKSIDEAAEIKLHLPEKILRNAKIMYRKFNKEKLTRGAVRTGIKANCILYSCKLGNIPRTTKEIAEAFGIPTKDISRTTDIFRSVMLSEVEKSDEKSTSGITKPIDVVSRLMNVFSIENTRACRVKCQQMAKKLEGCVQLMGKTPVSIGAVILLKILGEHVTKQEITKKCGVSLPTINKIEGIVNTYLEGLKE